MTTDQKVEGSTPSGCTTLRFSQFRALLRPVSLKCLIRKETVVIGAKGAVQRTLTQYDARGKWPSGFRRSILVVFEQA
jgi:hypothetical protein